MRSLRLCFSSRGISATLVLLLALLLVPSVALAQVETGQISGTVTDPQGAVVAGATITATEKATNAPRTATTSGEGNFLISNLKPGEYEVQVQAAGFAAKIIPVAVSVGTKTNISIELSITSTESIDVIAGESGVQVNTENAQVQTVVTERQIKELPTVTRNPYNLVGLSPNVNPNDAGARGAGFSINGARNSGNNILLDGSDNNDQFTASVGQDVPLDSVQEFTVLTSNFSAEYGRAAGGIINVATKSGTNEFHGTVYEFNRLSALASNSYENNALYPPDGASSVKKGVFTRNQFGYSVGGPIIKDKLLFFQNTEWIRVRSSDTVSTFVPTPEFIAASAPATQAFFSGYSLNTPINGRVYTVGQIGASLAPGGAFQGLPANLPAFGEVLESVPVDAGGGTPQNSYSLVGRVDYNMTDKTTMYGRYALQSQDFFDATNAYSPWSGFNTGATTFNNNFLFSLTHVWSDNFVSQSKFVYNRLNQDQPLGEAPLGPTLYLSGSASYLPSGDIVGLPGYLPFSPGNAIPFGGPQNLAQLYQDQTWTIGDHSIRFGGSYVRIMDNRTFGAYENAVEALGNSLQSGLNNLVLGTYRSFQVAINPQGKFPGDLLQLPASSPNFSRNNRYNEFALYANDSWKIHPRVTLNLGVRWDYFGVQHNKDQSLDSNFYLGEGATRQEQFANGKLMLAQDSPLGRLWKQDWNNVGPRVGIAWDVFGDGKTSLRGGYGISYERNFGNVTFNVIQNPPNYAVTSILNTTGAPIVRDNFGPFGSGTGMITVPRATVRGVNPDINTAYAQFWTVAATHEFMNTYVLSLEYTGSHGSQLYSIERYNDIGSALAYNLPYNPAAIPGVQPSNGAAYSNPQYGLINERGNAGFSNYNGLALRLDTREIGNTGLQFQANYTWSHALDNLSSTFSETSSDTSGSGNLGLLDPYNPQLDYGSAAYDVRHRFVSSGIWDIPFANKLDGWKKSVFDGWQITYIYTARTGNPFTVFDCTNGFAYCNRLLNAGNLQLEGSSNPNADPNVPNQFNYIDLTNQASQVGTFTGNQAVQDYFGFGGADYGPFPSNMVGRNTFKSPGIWNLDGGVYKTLDLTEGTSVQFRFEFFNLFNHANLYTNYGTADAASNTFVTASRYGRRDIQLAVKFIF